MIGEKGGDKKPDLERTIPDLPENRRNQRSSRTPAGWKPFQITPKTLSNIEPLNKKTKSNPGPKQEEQKQEAEADERVKQDLADKLGHATTQGDFDKVRELVEDKGADPNAKDSNGKTAMQYAGFMGRKEILEFFQSKARE